ncbi:hypothetical protein [Zeimonas arvi]|uniref:hypothetical protein n=1 Tax=Zeimonas arvi TaxID=2498847 RepID=UPI00165062C4|nr:hypothetical protein [Zeimonas arvi]
MTSPIDSARPPDAAQSSAAPFAFDGRSPFPCTGFAARDPKALYAVDAARSRRCPPRASTARPT